MNKVLFEGDLVSRASEVSATIQEEANSLGSMLNKMPNSDGRSTVELLILFGVVVRCCSEALCEQMKRPSATVKYQQIGCRRWDLNE